ncbi:DUF1445 domain-containing protein [Burkholderia sp. Cy-647]|nr:DUF1445 domain-containing protein [Burkholderia sp. Cy-647]
MIGCSLSFEHALEQAGLSVRHVDERKVVPMYRSAIPTVPVGPFRGPTVVSMRPYTAEQTAIAFEVCARLPGAHGAPLHVGDPADYPPAQPFRRPILAALAASPVLALELSPDDLLESADDVSKYGSCRYPCLPKLLPEPLWQRLAGRLRGNPAALDGIRRMRPWLAALVVETYDSLSAGLQTEYGTEAQLQNVFLKKKGARVVGLETLAEQMRAFTGLTLAEQREMLAQDITQTPAQNADDIKALHRLWRIGDADAVSAWANAKTERLAHSRPLAAAIDNKIVYERNRRFTARAIALAGPNRPLFVAIGALHLGGPKGVIELLKRQGFRVDAG